jgi:hypothetical protein
LAVVLFSVSVLPAPDFSPLHPVDAQPVTESPAPAIRLAMLRPANSFFNSFLSTSSSPSQVNKKRLILPAIIFTFPKVKISCLNVE